ncbi:hypothetical protein CQW23_31592 [Capsicum baccatum]|uniref:Uncharacterized protein n=1 Tax=Capsicum baccatum TaxID=33114 RepID=A0A2G2V745_CAPBA|nr:hypothetical protein CQW23_31592 [Capsicum baccatum]
MVVVPACKLVFPRIFPRLSSPFLKIIAQLPKQVDDGKGLADTVVDVNDANKRGLLIFAVGEGKTNLCKYLVEELKTDVNEKDETRSASLSMPMSSMDSFGNDCISVGYSGSLRSERQTSLVRMSGPLYVARNPENSFRPTPATVVHDPTLLTTKKYPSMIMNIY